MGDCQHTFCRSCLTAWISNRKNNVTCPICRAPLPTKPHLLHRNLLANQLISALEIRCSNRACQWTGKLEAIKSHLPDCEYREGNLPNWYKEYIRSCEEELEK